MPLPPPPAPKEKPEHHKPRKPARPTQTQIQHRFVNYYTNHGYSNLKEQWGNIQDIAQQTGLDPIYLAAYLMTHGGIRSDYHRIQLMAQSESARLGRTGGRDRATGKFIQNSPALTVTQKYGKKTQTTVYEVKGMGGSWGSLQDKKDKRKAIDQSINNPTLFKDKWGTPITKRDYEQEVAGLNDLFSQYLGRKVSKKEAVNIIKNQWSQIKIEKYLTKQPGFYKGDVWKQQSPQLINDWETVYGTGTFKPPRELIREAILRASGGRYWFQDQIRKLPQYKQSVEYKGLYASYSQQYSQIYGEIDDNGKGLIDNAIMKRITPEAFASSLRQMPEYANSFAMQGVWSDLGDLFGNVFGGYHPPVTNPNAPKPGAQAPGSPTKPPTTPSPNRPGARRTRTRLAASTTRDTRSGY